MFRRASSIFLILVSLLQPIEAIAAKCALKSAPLCSDATPCKMVQDPAHPTDSSRQVEVCLSTAAKQGALTTSASCWDWAATYDCYDASSLNQYVDSCQPIKNDTVGCPGYQEKSSKCAEPLNTTGSCPSFDVTYQCITDPGTAYTEENCGGVTLCVGSGCTIADKEKNNSLGRLAATFEISRQAGMYMQFMDGNIAGTDPTKIRVFGGENSHCSQNTLGLSDCCVPKKEGSGYTNQIIVQELIKQGWNAWTKDKVGSHYTFDTLYDSGSKLMEKAINGMKDVLNNNMAAGSPPVVGQPPMTGPAPELVGPPAPTPVSGMTQLGYGAGGMVGGVAGSMSAAWLAKQWNVNNKIAGVMVAIGTATGSAVGTMAAGWVMTSGSIDGAMASICTPCVTAALVIAIVMALVACEPEEIKVQLRLGAGICHWVGSYCETAEPITGRCMTRQQDYCCFNSKLAKIIQEQGREQIGRSWGIPGQTPDCTGLTVEEMSRIDFSKMDMTEFTKDIVAMNIPKMEDMQAAIAERTKKFYQNNAGNPTATNGVLLTQDNKTPQPLDVTPRDPDPKPPVAACNIAFQPGIPANDGSITGTFTVTNCNANASIAWSYIGTCPDVAKYAAAADIPAGDLSAVSSAGLTTFTRTLPAACFAAQSPTIHNAWKGMLTDPAAGYLGTITATWP